MVVPSGRAVYTRRAALALCISATGTAGAYEAVRLGRKRIPFLFTLDVHDQPHLTDVMSRCLDELGAQKVRATFFTPAVYADRRNVRVLLRRMIAEGHQIGCHGLDHNEDYYTDPFVKQRSNLTTATAKLADAIGAPISSFRAPAFRISRETLPILDELNYRADLSICSQRLPWLSSQVGNYHWLFARRIPYHPSSSDPYSRGSLNLLEIPTSALGVPLMSAINATMPWMIRLLVNILHAEATIDTKPIVYQCHLEDFVQLERHRQPIKLTWRSFIPSPKHGIPARWILADNDGSKIYQNNREVFDNVLGTSAFSFESVQSYMAKRGGAIR